MKFGNSKFPKKSNEKRDLVEYSDLHEPGNHSDELPDVLSDKGHDKGYSYDGCGYYKIRQSQRICKRLHQRAKKSTQKASKLRLPEPNTSLTTPNKVQSLYNKNLPNRIEKSSRSQYEQCSPESKSSPLTRSKTSSTKPAQFIKVDEVHTYSLHKINKQEFFSPRNFSLLNLL